MCYMNAMFNSSIHSFDVKDN
uniref:Uncharacterized protein n=1 Tax=Anguilla anguilla TaxID=7936 RepID=A0A0E9P8G5_ANGAN